MVGDDRPSPLRRRGDRDRTPLGRSVGSGRGSLRRASPSAGVEAVLFDFDDTLFDHTRALAEAIGRLRAEEPSLAVRPLRSVVAEYERLMATVTPSAGTPLRTHAQARAERFRRLELWAGGEGGLRRASEWSERYRSAYLSSRRPVEGALALLERLAGQVRVGVVTNNHTDEQLGKIDALGMGRWIDFLVTSEEVGVEKPDPRIFAVALDRARVVPSKARMVGDTWSTDIAGAISAGIDAVWLHRRGRARAAPPGVKVIRSLTPTQRIAALLLGDP